MAVVANSVWVRDELKCWHKAAIALPDEQGRYAVRCLNGLIDVDEVGLPGAGALICDNCMDAVGRDHLDHVGIFGPAMPPPREGP